MKTLLVLLGLALSARAHQHYPELWLDALMGKEGKVAWGQGHAWVEEGTGASPFHEGLPEGVVTVAEGQGAWWAVLRSGELRRLGGDGRDVWSLGHPIRAAAQEEDGDLWLVDDQGLTLVRLRGVTSPEARCRMACSGTASPVELRAGEGPCLLREGRRLLRLWPGRVEGLGSFPAAVDEWTVWQGGLWYLDEQGTLQEWDLSHGQEDQTLRPARHEAFPQPGFRRLLSRGKTLWLQEESGGWWRWKSGEEGPRAIAQTFPEGNGATWFPAGEWALVCQEEGERQWWTEERGLWGLEARVVRPYSLVARLVRQGGDWCLEAGGRLWQGRAGSWEDRGLHPGAKALWRGGSGPWLQLASGLKVFSEGGALIGGWAGPGEGGASLLEDYLLVAGEDSLRVFWTSEEDPWLQATLPLGEVELLSSSPVGAVALAEGSLHWVDLARPWLPRLEEGSPAPEGLLDMLLVEDRLLLATTSGLKVWTRRQGRWEATGCPLEGRELRWICPRGSDRVLALTEGGRLSQWRLVDTLPMVEEWSMRLPFTGRMAVERDSLRVLGESAWGDWPLPSLAGAPGNPVVEAEELLDAGIGPSRIHQVGQWLEVEDENPRRDHVQVHDLLGRRVAMAPLRGGRARLALGALPSGVYVVSLEQAPGSARCIRWVK